MGDVEEEWDEGADGEEYSDEEGESNSDGSDEDEEDIQLRHKRERMDRLKESPPSEIIEEAKQQARSEVMSLSPSQIRYWEAGASHDEFGGVAERHRAADPRVCGGLLNVGFDIPALRVCY